MELISSPSLSAVVFLGLLLLFLLRGRLVLPLDLVCPFVVVVLLFLLLLPLRFLFIYLLFVLQMST